MSPLVASLTWKLPFIPSPRLVFFILIVVGLMLLALREAALDLAGFIWGLVHRRTSAPGQESTAEAQALDAAVATALATIRERHAGFTPEAFLEDVRQAISLIQRARDERTPELVRDRLGAAAWIQLQNQVASASASRDPAAGPMTLKSAEVIAASSDAIQDTIKLRVNWIEDARDAHLGRDLIRAVTEDWTFGWSRRAGTRVNPDFWLLVQLAPISNTLVPRSSAA